METAYVVGVGETAHAPRRDDANTTELAWEAISAALRDAGVELAEVENAVTASQDFWEGRTISSMAVNEVAGCYLRSEAKVASDAAQAVMLEWARIRAGAYRLGLVVAHCKESQADRHAVELAAMDPFTLRALDPDETVAAGLQAAVLDHPEELRARVVAAARARSPWLPPVNPADVLSSPRTAAPLRALERAPDADGACALVMCDEATARRLAARGGRPVRVAGAGTSTDPYWTDRDLARAPAAGAALGAALAHAGWDGPPDTVEVAAPFAHQVLLWAGELGLGGAPEVVARIEADDGLAPRGGQLAGTPGTVAGLSAVIGCVGRLRRSAGRALAHGATGLLGQSHHVVLLESA